MDVKYEHLRIKQGDRVRITVTHRDTGLPYTAEGIVHSAYSSYVEAPGTPNNANFRTSALIGYSPSGIEMHDDTRGGQYGYWKRGDGGRVWKLVNEEWIQVYPIQFEGVVR